MRSPLAPLVLALLAALAPARPARGAGVDVAAEAALVEQLKRELGPIDARLQVIEKQYTYRDEPGEQEALKRRFSDAETQVLLKHFQPASVLLYDLVGSATFRGMREYPAALYMLGESLYQQQSYLGARLYLREHMNQHGDHYRDALSRYLEISGRLNEFSGIDEYIEQAKGPGGVLPADLAYVYGKWMFRRTDLPDQERMARSRALFEQVASAGGLSGMQAAYFLGVLATQQGDLAAAKAAFERVLVGPASGPRERSVREMANLALGRVYYELGKYTEALDHYQEIDYRSDNFVDALYEVAWTYVRRAKEAGPGEYEKADQACEKLLLAAPDSVLAPEVRLLQGHLKLKLGKYQEADESYRAVIDTYAEVYDAIDGSLKAHPDPVQYFQQAISSSGKTLDLAAFLPPIAVKWATTSRDVADAVSMTTDIDLARTAVAESREVAARLLDVLENRPLELFPQLQEGLGRAGAVDDSLTELERRLLAVEERLVAGTVSAGALGSQLDQARAERSLLEERFKALPKSELEVDARKARMGKELTRVDQEVYRLSLQVESLSAVLVAVEKYSADTRDQRKSDAQTLKEEADELRRETEIAGGLREELVALQKRMRDEKAKLGMGAGSGDALLREQYERALQREGGLMADLRSSLPADRRAVLQSVDEVRASSAALRARSEAAQSAIRDAVKRKAGAIREKVQGEALLLSGYDANLAQFASKAQNLVGSVAYDSFKRVRRQFYDLVLKANVGLADIAWTRKQDKTLQIQGLAKQKDREMKALDGEFKEVLKDVE